MTRTLRILTSVVALTLFVTACGDAGGDTTTTAGQAPGTVTTGGDGGDDGSQDTLGTIPDNLPGVSDDCIAISQMFATMGAASLVLTGQADFEEAEVLAQFEEARADLPASLQGDVDTVYNAMIDYFGALADLGIDFSDPQALAGASPADLAALQELATAFDVPAVEAAFDNLGAYAEAECPEFVE